MTAIQQTKVAFVTGAASGIGRATAEAFVRRGYATLLADRDAAAGERVQQMLRELGECALFIATSATTKAYAPRSSARWRPTAGSTPRSMPQA